MQWKRAIITFLGILCGIGGLWLPSAIHAQGDLDQELLEELAFLQAEMVVEVSTKKKISLSKSPGAVTVIPYEQIRKSGARSIPELLRMVPGVNVRWNIMMQTIDIRSFGQSPFTSRVLLLIDGVPYNSWNKGGFPQQPGFDFFPIENVKQLEVIRGPGSALYGENAYWGVLNIVTLSGDDFQGGELSIFTGDRLTRVGTLQYGKPLEDGSIFVSTKRFESQFPVEYWVERDSEANGFDAYTKVRHKGFEFSYYRHEDSLDGVVDEIGSPNFPPGTAFRTNDEIEQVVEIAAVKYEHTTEDKALSFSGDISYAQRTGSYCSSCHGLPDTRADFGKTADHGFQSIVDLRVGVHSLDPHDLLIGVESRNVGAGEHEVQLGTEVGNLDRDDVVSHYSKLAIYIQDQISLLGDSLNLFLGLRIDGATNPGLFEQKEAPRVAAVYQASDNMLIRGGWSKAFRFPSFSELYMNGWFFGISVPGNIPGLSPGIPFVLFEPNPDLEPESIESFEIGFEYHFTKDTLLKTDLFYSKLNDFIVIVQKSPPMARSTIGFENHPDTALIAGGEAELRTQITSWFTTFVNYAYQDHWQERQRTDSAGNEIEFVYAPRHKFNWGAFFTPFPGASGALEVMWKEKYDIPQFWREFRENNDVDIHVDDYTIVNLRLNYDIPVPSTSSVDRPLQLSVYGKNLLDERPEETVLFGSLQRVEGKEYFAGLTYKF